MRAVAALALILLGFGNRAPAADDFRTPSPALRVGCRCAEFDRELAEAERIFASREDDVAMPLTPVMHDRFRARVDQAYGRADCLAGCAEVPESRRNRARVLLAETGFKDDSLGAPEWRARLAVVLAATTRCLEIDPNDALCHLWHASSRGMLARGSWNPINLALPYQLMAEFRAARAGAPPGRDHDGNATRGEASMLLKVPRFAGGDPAAGRALIEEAARQPDFSCRVANRLVLAEARGRTGDLAGARAELTATSAAGLPSCSPQRYENAISLEECARCLARLDEVPGVDPGWDQDCRRP